MKSRYGFYSKLGYCEGVVEELGGEAPPPPPPHTHTVDETLAAWSYVSAVVLHIQTTCM